METETNAMAICSLIDLYEIIRRIKTADNVEEEINHQMSLVKLKLRSFGVVTDNLDREADE